MEKVKLFLYTSSTLQTFRKNLNKREKMQDSQNKINNSKHKNLSKTTEHQTDNTQDDSSQVYYIRPSGVRKPTSIRVDTGLWEAFKRTLSQKGLSTCEILEKIILGLTVGIKASEEHVIRSTTINVYAEIPKFVRRVRRARVEYVDERVEDSRFYCALKNEHVERQSLPLADCRDCPNRGCRGFVLERGVEEVE
jgi:hypothetical protein